MMEELNNFMVSTPDIHAERLDILKQILPDLFTNEGNLDPDELRLLLDRTFQSAGERYEFKWSGKTNSKRQAFTPSTATLKYDELRSLYPNQSDHIIIEGENLEVLKLLSAGYQEKIKCIYIDPPYNTGNDFVYSDNYTEDRINYWEKIGGTEGGIKIDTNPESAGRYHSAWLSMLYSRLLVARRLLRSDGAIFISIDDHEIHNLRRLMDEVFGPENFRNTFIVRRYDKNINRQFIEQGLVSYNTGFEYIVCYSKSDDFKFNPIYKESSDERQNYGYWKGFWNNANRPTMRYEILGFEPETGQWKWSSNRAIKAVDNYIKYINNYSNSQTLEEYWADTGKMLEFIRRNPEGKGKNKGVEHWIPPAEGILRNTGWIDLFASVTSDEIKGLFDFPKNVDVIKTIISSCEQNGDIILDFFAGSGTTGQAVLELNEKDGKSRQFILVQLPEEIDGSSETGAEALKQGFKTISQITIERCKRVIEGYAKGRNPIKSGFKVYKLTKSNFPRIEYAPNPDISVDENVEALKKYIKAKELDLHSLFNKKDIFDEVLLKTGFALTYKIAKQDQYSYNEIHLIDDEYQRALICLDPQIHEETINQLKNDLDKKFICLEVALDTSKKWNLKNLLGPKLRAI